MKKASHGVREMAGNSKQNLQFFEVHFDGKIEICDAILDMGVSVDASMTRALRNRQPLAGGHGRRGVLKESEERMQ